MHSQDNQWKVHPINLMQVWEVAIGNCLEMGWHLKKNSWQVIG